jgi:hypothetical protein
LFNNSKQHHEKCNFICHSSNTPGLCTVKDKKVPKVVKEAFKKISNTKVDWDIERMVLQNLK